MMHPWFKDYGKDMPRVTKKFFTGALSGLTIYLIIIVWIFKEEIDELGMSTSALVLTDKAFGTTIDILLFSFVAYRIYRTSKKYS